MDGSAEPNDNVAKYLQACDASVSSDSVLMAANIGHRLVRDYGKYLLAAMAAQEQMMRKKNYLFGYSPMVTSNDPILAERLLSIHTIGAIPLLEDQRLVG